MQQLTIEQLLNNAKALTKGQAYSANTSLSMFRDIEDTDLENLYEDSYYTLSSLDDKGIGNFLLHVADVDLINILHIKDNYIGGENVVLLAPDNTEFSLEYISTEELDYLIEHSFTFKSSKETIEIEATIDSVLCALRTNDLHDRIGAITNINGLNFYAVASLFFDEEGTIVIDGLSQSQIVIDDRTYMLSYVEEHEISFICIGEYDPIDCTIDKNVSKIDRNIYNKFWSDIQNIELLDKSVNLMLTTKEFNNILLLANEEVEYPIKSENEFYKSLAIAIAKFVTERNVPA